MFRRILVANRGEVAARVLRTCQRLGVEAVAVTTDADSDLSWLAEASRVEAIGGRRAYLDADALLDAARRARCAAVHPGWGFLSENASFAARCEAEGLAFIGPRPLSIRQMGDKAVARETMARLGLSPIPGSDGVVPDVGAAAQLAAGMGYPVLLKALAGGGGRGMRRVFSADELGPAFADASAEAASAFGDGGLYLEKLIVRGKHVELQVMGDGAGRVEVLGARECSVQRRHQKLIEESPPPGVDGGELAAVAAKARAALAALRYRGAGTVEMLQDEHGRLWFMEMNTRLQVEHTVTEAVTGLDLVEWQLRVACNEGLGALPAVEPCGHAIECRVNAEDVFAGFRPCPGVLTRLELPVGPGVRVDTHLAAGDRISPHYDSMIAKVIASGPTREAALDRMDAALAAMVVEGVETTIPLHRAILRHPTFRAGAHDTRFVDTHIDALLAEARP